MNGACGRKFGKNTLQLQKVNATTFVDPRTLEPPWEQCSLCHDRALSEKIVEFNHEDDSQRHHSHSSELCPECIKLGTWCGAARNLSKRAPRTYDAALLKKSPTLPVGAVGKLSDRPMWRTNAKGIEASFQFAG